MVAVATGRASELPVEVPIETAIAMPIDLAISTPVGVAVGKATGEGTMKPIAVWAGVRAAVRRDSNGRHD